MMSFKSHTVDLLDLRYTPMELKEAEVLGSEENLEQTKELFQVWTSAVCETKTTVFFYVVATKDINSDDAFTLEKV